MKQSVKIRAYLLLCLSILTIIITMKASAIKPTANVPLWSDNAESRITSLQSEISNLSDSANRWNGRYLRSLLVALIVGLWTLVCQYSAIQRSRLVSDKQSELLHFKDIEAARDSYDKDLRIGDANERAGIANQEAGKANQRAAQLEVDAANLKSQNLETESRLEAERKQRLEMEKSMSFRWITQHTPADFAALHVYAGTPFEMNSINEGEPQIAATQLFNVLARSGWNPRGGALNTMIAGAGGIFDGVLIQTYHWKPSLPQVPQDQIELEAYAERSKFLMDSFANSNRAANALFDFLKRNGWDAAKKVQWRNDADVPKDEPRNMITIIVTAKPNRYFLPEELKKAFDEYKRSTERSIQEDKDMDRNLQEMHERFRRPPPPEKRGE